MNKWLSLILILSWGCPSLLQAQKGWGLEIGAGAGVGWWVYNRGFSDLPPSLHQGYDRSYLSLSVPVEIAATYEFSRWQVGLGFGYRWWDVGRMVSTENRRGSYQVYRVAERGKKVQVVSLSGQARYLVIQQGRFSLGLTAKVGTFQARHAHPEAARMSVYLSQEVGLQFRFRWGKRFACWAQPQLGDQRIFSQGPFRGEDHHFYHLGFLAGVQWFLFPLP